MAPEYDIAIIGGGIHGCGIARDAAGRGLRVVLCEQGDLASHTSSASTKLIHGGLRYLEYGAWRLVRESLRERARLLRLAPHLVRPLRFVLPHAGGALARWRIRLGLLLYDYLGGRRMLAPSGAVDLRTEAAGAPLRREFRSAFAYSDCSVDDSRLTVLTAVDAAAHGADIRPRTRCVRWRRVADAWHIDTTAADGTRATVTARALVNAAGPWASEVHAAAAGKGAAAPSVRLVQGGHLVVRRMYEGDHAYLLQNHDRRVVFAIPYQQHYTLIGTTERQCRDPATTRISEEETEYLLDAMQRHFTHPPSHADIVSSYAGVRLLCDDGAASMAALPREYALHLDQDRALLSVFGGKITTHRMLAEKAVTLLGTLFPGRVRPPWTGSAALPGGDFPVDGGADLAARLRARCGDMDAALAHRLVSGYGTRALAVIGAARSLADLGEHFGAGLYAREVAYQMTHEWARTAEDVLWRRSRLGLALDAAAQDRLARWMEQQPSVAHAQPAVAPRHAATLELRGVHYARDGVPHIHPTDLTLAPGEFNHLLGATRAGKTTLMRLMAGLEGVSGGSLWVGGEEVTGRSVRARDVAMVYQQFVNYPTMTVFDNIAAPLRAGGAAPHWRRRVGEVAELLHISDVLDRMPHALSGGQQQRVALARALVRHAKLVLLDEPLANLDYKLREELREELPRLFAARESVIVYATTEPMEALLLGGRTAALYEGRVVQFGPSAEVYHHPRTLAAARIFSSPPLNELTVVRRGARLVGDAAGLDVPAHGPLRGLGDGRYRVAFRAHHLHPGAAPRGDRHITLGGAVTLSEISGSEQFIHVRVGACEWVVQTPALDTPAAPAAMDMHIALDHLMVFGEGGERVEVT